MKDMQDDVLLLEHTRRSESFFQRKIRLTVPICLLLITVFVSSAIIVSFVSYYWIGESICYVRNEQQLQEMRSINIDEPSRPKRSLTEKEMKTTPCFGFECCESSLDPNKPWLKPRLPDYIQPVEYQLYLELYNLSQPTDIYTGEVLIVIDVRKSTTDIILNAVDLLFGEITVTDHNNPDLPGIAVDCVIPFPLTETLIIHLKEPLQEGTRYNVDIKFFRALNVHGTGIFELQFNKDQYGLETSRMLLTHFEAVHAREAYPCFDEPGFKASFQLTVLHSNSTVILSNWDERESFGTAESLQTEFQTTPEIPTALTAFAIFNASDFKKKTVTTTYPESGRQVQITLWARNKFFDEDSGIYIDNCLHMIRMILDAYLEIFRNVTDPVVPAEMKFLAVPEYPSDAVSHWGLIIFTEHTLLHNPATTPELEHQRIALLIAKEIAQQWFGNHVSFSWWNDIWLEEAISNFLKYEAVDLAFPRWTVHDQFLVEELIPGLMDDSMSSSHPVVKSVNSPSEINELFDSIEVVKATALLRMADYYIEKSTNRRKTVLSTIVSYVQKHTYDYLYPDEFLSDLSIDQWKGNDFFDRWLLQSNFPKVFVHFIRNETENINILQFQQSRFLSAIQYEYDLYPSNTVPFGHVWYIPIRCSFGNDSSTFSVHRIFYLDAPTVNISFGNVYFKYFYCNTDFAGYYIIDYTDENWYELAELLLNPDAQMTDVDRANLVNNVFMGAQASDESYSVVREIVEPIKRDPDSGLLTWQALAYHLNRILDVLEYESLFLVVQKYFHTVVRTTYESYGTTLWNSNGTFDEQIHKQIIIQLACRLAIKDCIDTVTSLWNEAFSSLADGIATHSVPNHARSVVYNTHFRNTYNDSEWITIESEYHYFTDVQERERLLEALTQTRQPWHLYQLLYNDAEANRDRDVDLLEVLSLLARNPIGRELVWLYYRENWSQLQIDYGRTNQRLGQLLIDVTATFEDEFHELELMDFLASTPGVETNVDARFWSLERANMNFWWVIDNTEDITDAFEIEEKHHKH